MNPWGIIVIFLGIVLIVLGVKGTYPGVETLITGKPHQPLSNVGGVNQQGGGFPFLPFIPLASKANTTPATARVA